MRLPWQLRCRGCMKQIIKSYSFNKTARSIIFTDFSTISLDRILVITNVTAGVMLYQFNDPALGGSVAANVLTLTYGTSAMNNTDKLQIIYDCASGDPTYDWQFDTHGNLNVNLATALVAEDAVNNALRVEGTVSELAGLSTAATINNFLVPSTDVSAFRELSLQISGTWTGNLVFECSNDSTNWNPCILFQTSSASSNGQLNGINTNSILYGAINFKYFRVRVSVTGTGTVAGDLMLFTVPGSGWNGGIASNQQGLWFTSTSSTPTVTTVAVTTSSTSVLAANASRKGLILSNVGANNIYINWAGGAATNNQMLMTPSSTLVLDRLVPATAITAIAATATTNLSVTELV
jgi:hypothetical protein